jgi:hypothetical protein
VKNLLTLALTALMGVSLTVAVVGCSGSTPAKKEPEKGKTADAPKEEKK